MKKFHSKQLYIEKLDYPYDSLKQIVNNDQINEQIFIKDNLKIKKFIGSGWSIKDSGFIFYGPNDINVVFSIKNIENNDFIYSIKYLITHLNGFECNKEIYYYNSLIKNTNDNSSIIESRLEYEIDFNLDELEKYINLTLGQKIIKKIYLKIKSILNEKININKNLIINHSFTIKKNYKDAFNFFYNWNNMAKSIKADKSWKIIIEDNDKKYKDFDIIINDSIKVHYHIISIDEVEGEKIEIVYNKTNNSSSPALNHFIKFSFFKISKDLCFFLYETHLPINITSPIYETISHYVYYCNKKSKKYIENNL
jgi:hypothetical protein